MSFVDVIFFASFTKTGLHTSLRSTIVDLRLNENKIRSVHYSSLSRFGNLTYLNLTKNDISYVEDGAFSAQFNLQVSNRTNAQPHTNTLVKALGEVHTHNGGSTLTRKCDVLSLQKVNFINITLLTPLHAF